MTSAQPLGILGSVASLTAILYQQSMLGTTRSGISY